MAKKQPKHLQKFADQKQEITERIKALGVNASYAITGDRNYVLEDDGSLYIESSHTRTPVSRWTAQQWDQYKEDCSRGLWTKLTTRFGDGGR